MLDSVILKVVLAILMNAANGVAIWATGRARQRSRATNAPFESGQLDLWSEQLMGKWWALRVIVWIALSALCVWMARPIGTLLVFLSACSIAFRSVQQLNKQP